MNATKIIAISRHRHHAATSPTPALLSPVSVKTDGTDGTGGTALIRKGFFCAAMLFSDGTDGTNCAAFSVLALGLDALALATLAMLVLAMLDALGLWPMAQACDWAGPAIRVSARAASAGLLTPLHLV